MAKPELITYSYDGPEHTAQVKYAFFEKIETNMSRRICVFSIAGESRGPSSINCAENIIDAICDKESLSWRDITFCDLQTHIGYSGTYRGYYSFDTLEVGEKPRRNCWRESLGCNYMQAWYPTACPLVVFKAFEDLIGPFLSLKEVISRDWPCYKDYTDEQMQAEMEWAIEHVKRSNHWEEWGIKRYKGKIYTPQQAKDHGYLFNHSCYVRVKSLPDKLDKCGNGGVYVDLKGSHLLGQHNGLRLGYEPLYNPYRFSYWERAHS